MEDRFVVVPVRIDEERRVIPGVVVRAKSRRTIVGARLGWLAIGLAFPGTSGHLVSFRARKRWLWKADCPLLAPPGTSRTVLAMQKVEGSSPFIRLIKPPGNGGFFTGRSSSAARQSLVGLG